MGLMTYGELAGFGQGETLAEVLGNPTRTDSSGVERAITCCHHLRQIARARAGLSPCPPGLGGLGQGGWRSWGPIARARARYRAWGGRHAGAAAREKKVRKRRSREARFQREFKSAISFGPGTKQFQFFLKRWPYRKAQIDRVLKSRARIIRRGSYAAPPPKPSNWEIYKQRRAEDDRRRRAWNRKIEARRKRERAAMIARERARPGPAMRVGEAVPLLEYRFRSPGALQPFETRRAPGRVARSIAAGAARASVMARMGTSKPSAIMLF